MGVSAIADDMTYMVTARRRPARTAPRRRGRCRAACPFPAAEDDHSRPTPTNYYFSRCLRHKRLTPRNAFYNSHYDTPPR